MASLLSDTTLPLTVSEQLNAMLSGWLDRHAPDGHLGDADQTAAGVITVASAHVPEVETFCADWGMSVSRSASRDGAHDVLIAGGGGGGGRGGEGWRGG